MLQALLSLRSKNVLQSFPLFWMQEWFTISLLRAWSFDLCFCNLLQALFSWDAINDLPSPCCEPGPLRNAATICCESCSLWDARMIYHMLVASLVLWLMFGPSLAVLLLFEMQEWFTISLLRAWSLDGCFDHLLQGLFSLRFRNDLQTFPLFWVQEWFTISLLRAWSFDWCFGHLLQALLSMRCKNNISYPFCEPGPFIDVSAICCKSCSLEMQEKFTIFLLRAWALDGCAGHMLQASFSLSCKNNWPSPCSSLVLCWMFGQLVAALLFFEMQEWFTISLLRAWSLDGGLGNLLQALFSLRFENDLPSPCCEPGPLTDISAMCCKPCSLWDARMFYHLLVASLVLWRMFGPSVAVFLFFEMQDWFTISLLRAWSFDRFFCYLLQTLFSLIRRMIYHFLVASLVLGRMLGLLLQPFFSLGCKKGLPRTCCEPGPLPDVWGICCKPCSLWDARIIDHLLVASLVLWWMFL